MFTVTRPVWCRVAVVVIAHSSVPENGVTCVYRDAPCLVPCCSGGNSAFQCAGERSDVCLP